MRFGDIAALCGAAALFLFGMELLCAALRRLSGTHLRRRLIWASASVWRAVALSAAATALVQSSSAVTVVIVGLAAGGLLSPLACAGLIAGANIGTCSTAFLVHFGLRAPWMHLLCGWQPLLALAALFPFLLRRRCPPLLSAGAGLAALLTGMAHMQQALAPLSASPLLARLLRECSAPLTGLLAGALVTAVLQSSSACITILQAVSASGLLSLAHAVPIILGQNLGTCITALISGLGAKPNAKRAALIRLYYNIIGVGLFMVIFYALNAFIHFPFLETYANPAGIALVHTLFNIAEAIVLFPMGNILVKLATATVKDKPGETEGNRPKALDLLDSRAGRELLFVDVE